MAGFRARTRKIAGFAVGAAILAGLVGVADSGSAGADRSFPVGPFSAVSDGSDWPAGWRPLTFPKVPRHTEYTLVKDDGVFVVRAASRSSASGLVHPVRIDLKEYPLLRWRWKVSNAIKKGDIHKKEGDDYAGRIYVTFEYDPEKVSLAKKVRYRLGRMLFGDIPIAALNYIWDGRAPEETIANNAYTDFGKMIVVESGDGKSGRWVEEERNVYEDYKRAFGEDPTAVNGVAIMTDTDNTGESVTAYYGDIAFAKAP